MPSDIRVQGLSDSQYNGVYIWTDEYNGKPYYELFTNTNVAVLWESSFWYLRDSVNGEQRQTNVPSDAAYPWLAIGEWSTDEGIDGTGIIITERILINPGGPESQNTFGLPADVVALVTSRFGTVANYLRLRNLGYI